MKSIGKKTGYAIVIIFAIIIGFYPLLYYFVDWSQVGLTSTKGDLIYDLYWKTAFYLHITGGGIALIIGWIQFSGRFRRKWLMLHRRIGITYILSIFLGGLAGFYLALHANGPWMNDLGFALLAIAWLGSTFIAYRKIRQQKFEEHKNWMIRSYAITFAAVMLRLWMPVLMAGFGLTEVDAYATVAWLCWVPNVFVAELIVWRKWVTM
jgi:hypothetical protein